MFVVGIFQKKLSKNNTNSDKLKEIWLIAKRAKQAMLFKKDRCLLPKCLLA